MGKNKKKENPYASVYNATTVPLNATSSSSKCKANANVSTKTKKPPRRDKSDLGENFIAPDGGWAWLVCIAAGISNVSSVISYTIFFLFFYFHFCLLQLTIYPCIQQFGFMFRDRLNNLGLTSSQITTIINTHPAVSSCTGEY